VHEAILAARIWKGRLHSAADASPAVALLLAQIRPVFSVVAPCRPRCNARLSPRAASTTLSD
jgi:hypothetical protein